MKDQTYTMEFILKLLSAAFLKKQKVSLKVAYLNDKGKLMTFNKSVTKINPDLVDLRSRDPIVKSFLVTYA